MTTTKLDQATRKTLATIAAGIRSGSLAPRQARHFDGSTEYTWSIHGTTLIRHQRGPDGQNWGNVACGQIVTR